MTARYDDLKELLRCLEARGGRRIVLGLATIAMLFCAAFGVVGTGFAGERGLVALEELGYSSARRSEIRQLDREEVTPATWRRIELRHTTDGGDVVDVVLLRPLWWIDRNQAVVGQDVELHLEELGVSGPAAVLAIGPCEVDGNDPSTGGRVSTPAGPQVVTGHFVRTEVVQTLEIETESGEVSTITVTPEHPVYSLDRRAFVPVAQLRHAEVLSAIDGSVLRLRSRGPPEAARLVHNLEVHREHVYAVGPHALLVHNTCHGNSRGSQKPQHGYVIKDSDGQVVKVGISGQPLNGNGSSPRANRQANKWNKEGGGDGRASLPPGYTAEVVWEDGGGPGARARALEWERDTAAGLRSDGNLSDPSRHTRP